MSPGNMWIVNIGVLYFITLLNFSHSYSGYTRAESKNHFPKDFIFGASTSAYQIEGAWNVDGKGENIWDRFVHVNRSRILNNDTADIACDSYHKYKEDVALAASLGFSMYRFSISWARILPTGNKLNVNEAGLKYYENLVEEINKYNMKAMVTLYHWDLPQCLQEEFGGWASIRIVDKFMDFSRIVIKRLKKVAYWITINEPKQLCNLAYETGGFAPGVYNKFYECVYSVLMCHASVYHMYKKEFADREGKMSIALDFPWSEPKTNSANDRAAASRNIDFEFGIYADPIILGDYPKVVKERAIKRSLVNSTLTELHVLSPDEIKFIKGTFDYMAINHYTTYYVQDAPEGHSLNAYENDKQVITSSNPAWEHDRLNNSAQSWGLRKMLKYLKQVYNDPVICLTELGYSDDGKLNDDLRARFFQRLFGVLLQSMHKDGVKIIGASIWSLLDDFEWVLGYYTHFGIIHVDQEDPTRKRTPKKSTLFFKKLTSTRRIPEWR